MLIDEPLKTNPIYMATPSALDAAKLLLLTASIREDEITNLKLQKLLYYFQGASLAILCKPGFEGAICAWDYGPVVPEVYHAFKSFGRSPIAISGADEEAYKKLLPKFAKEHQDLASEVYSVYGQYAAWKLVEMTHSEPPWKDNYEVNQQREIPHKDLEAYFKTQIAD